MTARTTFRTIRVAQVGTDGRAVSARAFVIGTRKTRRWDAVRVPLALYPAVAMRVQARVARESTRGTGAEREKRDLALVARHVGRHQRARHAVENGSVVICQRRRIIVMVVELHTPRALDVVRKCVRVAGDASSTGTAPIATAAHVVAVVEGTATDEEANRRFGVRTRRIEHEIVLLGRKMTVGQPHGSHGRYQVRIRLRPRHRRKQRAVHTPERNTRRQIPIERRLGDGDKKRIRIVRFKLVRT